jgi:hypothetical protein
MFKHKKRLFKNIEQPFFMFIYAIPIKVFLCGTPTGNIDRPLIPLLFTHHFYEQKHKTGKRCNDNIYNKPNPKMFSKIFSVKNANK